MPLGKFDTIDVGTGDGNDVFAMVVTAYFNVAAASPPKTSFKEAYCILASAPCLKSAANATLYLHE